MDRRQFLKYLAGSGLAIGASSWLSERLWALHQEGVWDVPDRKDPGPRDPALPVESYVNSVCTLCPGGCAIRIRRHEGLPVHLAGNPLSPVNEGGLCPLGIAGLQVLYHPDRVQQPLLRVGEHGEKRWKRISWPEGLRILQDRLRTLRDRGETHRLAFIDGSTQDTTAAVIAQFMRAYGSPNLIRPHEPTDAQIAMMLTQGGADPIAYDLPNARLILSFGFDFLEAEGAPVWQTGAYGKLRTSIVEKRASFVHVEPRLSLTAIQADRWLPARPGTEGAVALGIAHVLLREGLYDDRFVDRYGSGFEDWVDENGVSRMGFKSRVLERYAPETVAQLTGVPVEDLVKVARAFASRSPSIAIAGEGATSHTNGIQTQLAVQALNALMGRIGRPGGLLRAHKAPLTPLPDFEPDAVARRGLNQPALARGEEPSLGVTPVESLAESIERGEPYTLDSLLIYESDPAFGTLDVSRTRRALEKIPFVVSFSSFIDDTALVSDLVLPIHTFLESWGDVTQVPGIGWKHLAIQQPAIEPLYDTRHPGQILLDIAYALGDATARAFPRRKYVELLKYRCRGVFDAPRGGIVTSEGEPSRFATFDEFWAALLRNGVWTEPYEYPSQPSFQTASQKYEFDPIATSRRSTKAETPKATGEQQVEVADFVGDPVKFPFHLYVFDTNTLAGGKGALLPLTMEMVGIRHDIAWDGWVEINPTTARRLNIHDGQVVWIESVVGRISARAKVWSGIAPDVVAMPLGLGHQESGRYAQGRGANPWLVLARARDERTDIPARLATRVKILTAG